jgi:pimeloyl-ACP methyl ester carboxylesterase
MLASIRAPTLLLWGRRDAMIPIANADDYAKALADARLVTFPNAGHLPHEEAAADSLAAVQAFLGH